MSFLRPETAAAAAACVLLTPSLLGAQSSGGPGERAQGMGTAFAAVADDATAVYWNPAGLGNLFKFDAQLEVGEPPHASETGSNRPAFAGAAIPALGVAYYSLRTAALDPRDRHNEGAGGVRVSPLTTRNFGVTLVQTIVNTVVVGSTLRLVNGGGSSDFDLDAGAIASLKDVRVGVSARNLRAGLGMDRQVRVGAAWAPRALPTGINGPFTVAADFDVNRTTSTVGEERKAAVGSEQWWARGGFATRFGINWSTVDEARPAVSGGFTVRLPHLMFAEGHLTKARQVSELGWGVGLRVAF